MVHLTRFSETQGYVAWNGGVISKKKKKTENNARRSGCSLVEHIIKATAWQDRGKELEMSVQSVSQLKDQAGHLINRVRRAKILRENLWDDIVVVL